MGIRDKEIKRLIQYSKGLGVEVVFCNVKAPDDTAEWLLDGTKIFLYTRKNKTKISKIISIIHELGHHLDFIHRTDRQIDTKFEEALPSEDETDISQKRRKVILDSETKGAQYWELIYKETNMSFSLYKLHAQMEFDIWCYEMYYENGNFPKIKDCVKKRKEIYAKHRKINYEV